MPRLSLAWKALRELGWRQVGLYSAYQILLRSGYLRRATSDWGGRPRTDCQASALLRLPDQDALARILGDEGLHHLLAEADHIVDGQYRQFGVVLAPIQLTPPGALSHWTDYETGRQPWGAADPKLIWEPARFGWTFVLGRAYHLHRDERYPAAFWRYFKAFQAANPVNHGPNWASAQEVALRILAFAFAAQIFAPSPHTTAARRAQLMAAIAEHAGRIPPTLLYARAQNNNHLLSEAAGLITAARCLPDHPEAPRWNKLGWRGFNRGLQRQIDAHGAYSQNSANYHRLMLQLALWVNGLQRFRQSASAKWKISESAARNLRRATRWLLALVDAETGHVPNLGPNDGAYVLPLASQPFADYRPTLQAAAGAFLGDPAFAPGPWDEMGAWLPVTVTKLKGQPSTFNLQPTTLRANNSWAYLRAAHFSGRPGHADQLHVDLWWRGLNIAQDAGTYLYNAAPPWENALTRTQVHNTVTLNDQEQMTRAGRFLYLDRAQAQVVAPERAPDGSWQRVVAEHDGYRRLGVIHRRALTVHADERWLVTDELIPASRPRSALSCCLHWLLPDWPWALDEEQWKLELESPRGRVALQITTSPGLQPATRHLQLVRAGERLAGTGAVAPYLGWVSPTYAHKVPALAWRVAIEATPPFALTTEWRFPTA